MTIPGNSRPRPRVVVTRRLPDAVHAALRARFDAVLNEGDEPLSPAALAAAVRDADALLPTVTDRIDAAVLGAGPRLRIVANFGVGFEHIDLAAAAPRGIVVTNTPDVLTDDTADVAIGLMLMTMRRLGEGERLVRAGAWDGWRPTQMLGTSLANRTLGIVGFGRIGRAVARRARLGLGMRVLYISRHAHGPDGDARMLHAERSATLEALLAESDVVSLHCPLTAETRHLIDAARLTSMRRGAYLINTARGGIVDERALAAALRDGHLAGAGLDVHEAEPRVSAELLALPNVVLLPHLGSATRETREAMGMRAVANLVAFFEGREPRDRVG